VRVLRNGKPIADIVPVVADLPSWKRRKAQPLVLDSVSVSRMILEEREAKVIVAGGYRTSRNSNT
jgi:antitoxin (DNA-binding transcriptional repressor) of toxin-antitoxin stability system